jgi:hypothetical protein
MSQKRRMKMDKKEIMKIIRQQLGNNIIKISKNIDLREEDCDITIFMPGPDQNMQTDVAAFEGWILGIKSGLDMTMRSYIFTLDWPRQDPNSGHYQRFLYRVYKFNEIFGGKDGWFRVKNPEMFDDLKIDLAGNEAYYLNSPDTKTDRTNSSTDSVENYLENQIIKNQDKDGGLRKLFPVSLTRQLPVGVFTKSVNKNNSVFTGGKSAVDIWGIGEDKELYIFELKAKDNKKVGILSEIFFYAMVLNDEQTGKFERKKNVGSPFSPEGEKIRKTKSLNALILTPEIHPLLSQNCFNLLNEALRDRGIKFGYVKMDYVMEPVFRFEPIWS